MEVARPGVIHRRGSQQPHTVARWKSWGALFLFASLAAIVCFAHEPWRDEYQALLIARASESISDVIWRARYEGHPSLWYILLHLLPSGELDVSLAKLMNLAFITGAAALVLFLAPFRFAERIAIVSGYFFLFEYAAFFRNYAVAVFLILATIALLGSRRQQLRTVAFIPLCILPFTQIYGALTSMALYLAVLSIHVSAHRWTAHRQILILSLAYLVALSIAILDTIPASDGNFYGAWSLTPPDLLKSMGISVNVFIPMPPFRIDFWNKLLVDDLLPVSGDAPMLWPKALIGVVLVALATRTLIRSRPAMVLFLAAFLLIYSFCALRYHGLMRHHGMVFIAYLGARWLSRTYPDDTSHSGGKPSEPWGKALDTGWYAVLAIHIVAGFMAIAVDIKHPFSGATTLSRFIREQGWQDRAILAQAEHCGISVAGALDHPVIYLTTGREEKYMNWDNTRRWGIPGEEYMERFRALDLERPGALLLTTAPLDTAMVRTAGLIEVFAGHPAIQRDETFALYLLGPSTE